MKSKFYILAAAAFCLLATACKKENRIIETPITIHANYDSAKINYTESGDDINVTWEADDIIKVVVDGQVSDLSYVSGAGSTSATFSGTIYSTHELTSTTELTLYVCDAKYPNAVTINADGPYTYASDAFLTQDGTMDSAASRNLFYGTATYGDGTDICCNFSVNTSMLKFTLTNVSGDAGTTATLTYRSGNTAIAKAQFTVGSGNNTVYLSIPAEHYSGTQTLEYICEDAIVMTYQLSATQANFVAGHTYSKDVELVFDPYRSPLTFEAKAANSTVLFYNMTSANMSYNKYDGNGWCTCSNDNPITVTSVGGKVSFRGNNGTFSTEDVKNVFSCSENSSQWYVYGNIMSLLYATDYPTATTLPNYSRTATFNGLFINGTGVYSHSSKKLVLPATTLTAYCYQSMFNGCSNLTTAPDLPATNLVYRCYAYMFKGCSNLSSVKCLAGNNSNNKADNTYYWLQYAGSSSGVTKTVYVLSAADPKWTLNNDSRIPGGWTKQTVTSK